MNDEPPPNLADALLQLLKARGLSDDDAIAVLSQVIAESPAFQGKWGTQGPAPTDEGRLRLAERLETSDRLRSPLRELGYDADQMAMTAQKGVVRPEEREP
jgi:hypothetical protein